MVSPNKARSEVFFQAWSRYRTRRDLNLTPQSKDNKSMADESSWYPWCTCFEPLKHATTRTMMCRYVMCSLFWSSCLLGDAVMQHDASVTGHLGRHEQGQTLSQQAATNELRPHWRCAPYSADSIWNCIVSYFRIWSGLLILFIIIFDISDIKHFKMI